MNKLKWMIRAAIAALALASTAVLAFDPASVPPGKRTQANLYLASAEVPAFLEAKGGRALFIDVRTPAELLFVGSAPLMDANVPVRLGPTAALRLEANPGFVSEVERRMAAKSLSKSDPVILMCCGGERSAAAADLLTGPGFAQVYSVIDGFEGDVAKDGLDAGHRAVNGWKNSGLPWGYSLDKEKLTLAEPVR